MTTEKPIVPCSEIWLHDFPNLEWDTKCKDCGKTVDEITGIRKDLAKLKKENESIKETRSYYDEFEKAAVSKALSDFEGKIIERINKITLGEWEDMTKRKLKKIISQTKKKVAGSSLKMF